MNRILIILSAVALIPMFSFGDTFESWHIGGGFFAEVSAIAMISDTDGWAILGSGECYHWDGREWRYKTTLSYRYDNDLEYYDANHIYHFSDGGPIHIFNGADWVLFQPAPPIQCHDLQVTGANDLWVSSIYKTAHWNGSEWTVYDFPDALYGSCIGFGSPDEGWSAGYDMAHFYDGQWHFYGHLTDYIITSADFANTTYGVMDGPHVSMWYFDSTWDPGGYLPNIFTDCYAINDEYFTEVAEYPEGIYLIHNNTVIKGYGAGAPLYCVFATSPHSIWAGGADGYICHWVWTDIQPASLGNIKAMFVDEGQSLNMETKSHFFAPQNPLIYGGQHSP